MRTFSLSNLRTFSESRYTSRGDVSMINVNTNQALQQLFSKPAENSPNTTNGAAATNVNSDNKADQVIIGSGAADDSGFSPYSPEELAKRQLGKYLAHTRGEFIMINSVTANNAVVFSLS